MIHCPESIHAQDYLDGELVPSQREAFEAHLAGCSDCRREVALYRHVLAEIHALEQWDPSAGLADRVLAEVMPRHAARWVPVAAWGAAGSLAASAALVAAAITMPGPRAWLTALGADATRSMAGGFIFVTKSLNTSVLHALDGLSASNALLVKLGTFFRLLAVTASQPQIAFTLWAALLAGGALLWWMRPREHRAIREDHHVGLLGL
jgi:hypothetical protein